MSTSILVTLTASEIRAVTGYVGPSKQLRELQRLGFSRARRGADGVLIVERAHYEAVCAGAVVLPIGELARAIKALPAPLAGPPAAKSDRLPASPPETPAAKVPQPSKRPPTSQKVTLEDWAAAHYDPAPTAWVMGQWRRAGQIHPPPERVGRVWFVEPGAQRVTFDAPRPSLVWRLKNGA